MSTKQLIQQGGRLGRYQLITRLATGGMAEVWLARATGAKGFQKTIVVKTILPHLADDPDFLNMFINEALLAAALNHPNIVQIFDLGQIGERYFIAMEFIVGRTMRQIQRVLRKRHKVMPVWLVLRVIVAVCDALDYAHNRRGDDGGLLGIVHRDITPENIMISFSGVTKVVDFGIAKATTSAMITQGGKIKGKLSYLAPEQIIPNGKFQVDRRTDIYALGVVLYEMLTGVRPFRASNDIALLLKIPKELPTPPSEIARWVPTRLSDIVMRALEKDSEKRFQSGRELGADLEGFLTSVGMYPTERQVSEYMCKLFDEDERKVIASGSLAAKALGKDSFEISSGSDIKGPDSAGSITVDIPDSALVSTSVSESLQDPDTDPKQPSQMVQDALRESSVQLAKANSTPSPLPRPAKTPSPTAAAVSPPPLPPDVARREKKSRSEAKPQKPISKTKGPAKVAGSERPTPRVPPSVEQSLVGFEDQSQRTEPDIALDIGDPARAEVPSIEVDVPSFGSSKIAETPSIEIEAGDMPSIEVSPSSPKQKAKKGKARAEKKPEAKAPKKAAETRAPVGKEEKKKKTSKIKLVDEISIEISPLPADASSAVLEIDVPSASASSIEVEQPGSEDIVEKPPEQSIAIEPVDVQDIEITSAAPGSAEITIEDESLDVVSVDSGAKPAEIAIDGGAKPAEIAIDGGAKPAEIAIDGERQDNGPTTQTVWSGRPTKSIAWDALVQRSMAETVDEEENGAENDLSGETRATSSLWDDVPEHADEDQDSQTLPLERDMSASHSWDSLVSRVSTEMTLEEREGVEELDSSHQDDEDRPEVDEPRHQHMWDAFISKRVSTEEPSIQELWGRGRKTDQSRGQVRDDDPWSGNQPDPHTVAAAKFDEGLVLIRDGKQQEALRAWEEAVELWPDNKKYQGNLRLLRKTTGGDEK